jgi:hypothetical protein
MHYSARSILITSQRFGEHCVRHRIHIYSYAFKDAANDDDLERILVSRFKQLKRILTDSRAAAARGETVSLDEAFAHLEP